MGFFDKIKQGLAKTRAAFTEMLNDVFDNADAIDEDFFDELEETLVMADLGMETVNKIMKELRYRVQNRGLTTTEHVKFNLKLILNDMLNVGSNELNLSTKPSVVLVIGVNGVGKTTTIGKIATQLVKEGKKVMLVAGDTFRAAAADQLEIWAGRSGASIVRQNEGADPASVVYDGIQSARAKAVDVIIIDTAGRLHNKVGLMNELTKIKNVMKKVVADAPHEVLLVLDGSTGQNAFEQAKQFTLATEVTAMAITKLDGTAKGGVVIGISEQFKIPVKYIGLGEGIEDMQVFRKKEFVDSLFGETE